MMPLKDSRVTYPYGVKNDVYVKGYHTGIDLVAEDYTVFACIAGSIQEARFAAGKGADPTGWGNYVILRTTDKKYDIIYAHLSSVQVVKGETVAAGTVLGIMGSTGNSTGPHLHFEVRKATWGARNDISPAAFLGIKNVIGVAESVPHTGSASPKKSIPDMVLCNAGADERAAAYLAEYLGTEVMLLHGVGPDSLKDVEHVYVIGSDVKPVKNCTNIVGVDRYDTARRVLALCQKTAL